MKLYSDIVKRKEMDHTEIPLQTVQGISVAFGYGLNLIPGSDIKADGNCAIELVMDQMKRYSFLLLKPFPSVNYGYLWILIYGSRSRIK